MARAPRRRGKGRTSPTGSRRAGARAYGSGLFSSSSTERKLAAISSLFESPNTFFHKPVRSFPMMSRLEWFSLTSTYWPNFPSAWSTDSRSPVSKCQPGFAPRPCAYFLSLAGVSVSGSTEMERKLTSLPRRSPATAWSSASFGIVTEQTPWHVEKNAFTTTTFPFNRSS